MDDHVQNSWTDITIRDSCSIIKKAMFAEESETFADQLIYLEKTDQLSGIRTLFQVRIGL